MLLLTKFLAKILPPIMARWLAYAIGEITHLYGDNARLSLRANLERVMNSDTSNEVLDSMVRQGFHNLYLNYYDLLRIPNLSKRQLKSKVEFFGMNHFDDALALGKGVILVSAHLGNLDLVLQSSLSIGLKFNVLAEQLQPQKVHEFHMRLRRSRGLTFEPVSVNGIRSAFLALERGEFVCVASDRAIQGRTIVTDFFDHPAIMPTGAADLALRTGSTILPAYNIRINPDKYRVFVEPPIAVALDPGNKKKIQELTNQIITIMEPFIRQYPEQWMAFEPIWEHDREILTSHNFPEDHASMVHDKERTGSMWNPPKRIS